MVVSPWPQRREVGRGGLALVGQALEAGEAVGEVRLGKSYSEYVQSEGKTKMDSRGGTWKRRQKGCC